MSVLVFENIHYLMVADDILKHRNVKYKIVPLQEELTHECSLAIEVDNSLRRDIEELLKKEGVNQFSFIEEAESD